MTLRRPSVHGKCPACGFFFRVRRGRLEQHRRHNGFSPGQCEGSGKSPELVKK